MNDHVDRYLEELRTNLRALPVAEVDDIVEEMRSHIRDRCSGASSTDADAADVAAVLERLGSPPELAALYARDHVLEGARRGRSPFVLAGGVFRWASLSAAGAFVFACLLAGYFVAGSLVVAALHEPFAPDRVGLFRQGDSVSLRLGFTADPLSSVPAGEEVLGFWIIPIGLLAGAMTVWLTNVAARACVRSLRRAPVHGSP